MINSFIAAIVALFFFGKVSKDVEEKTQLASITKTIFYGVMSFVFCICLYKIHQVATIINYVEVVGIRESVNPNVSGDQVADTISVLRIINNFNSAKIDNREIINLQSKIDRNLVEKTGGVFVQLHLQNHEPYIIRTKEGYNFRDYSYMPTNNVGHFYRINCITNKIPSLFPIFYSIEHEFYSQLQLGDMHYQLFDAKRYPDYSSYYITKPNPATTQQDIIHKFNEPFPNSYVTILEAATDTLKIKTDNKPYTNLDLMAIMTETNTMGFFTAADVSKYIQQVQLRSSCPIYQLILSYDVPINVTAYTSGIYLRPTAVLFDKDYIKSQEDNSFQLLVELPTMENLQLIRSLILTTLVTAFISLFLTNLYYLLRKSAICFREKYIEEINEKKLNRMRWLINIIIFILIGYILFLAIKLYGDKFIFIEADNIITIIGAVAVLFILLVIFMVWQFRKIYLPKKSNKKK